MLRVSSLCNTFNPLFVSIGRLYCWGKNESGCLGINNARMRILPEQNNLLHTRIHSIDINDHTVIALDENGCVYTWGNRSKIMHNAKKQPVYFTEYKPTRVDYLNSVRIRNVACGEGYFLALTYDGFHVFIWGEDIIYNTIPSKIMHRISGMNLGETRKIKKIVSGKRHAVFLLTNGEVWGLGDMFSDRIFPDENENKQDFWQEVTPETLLKPFRLPIQENIIDVQCGETHTLYLDNNNNAYISGYYTNIKNDPIYKIATEVDYIFCGMYSSLFYRKNAKTEIMGENANGELSTKAEHIPVIRNPIEIILPV